MEQNIEIDATGMGRRESSGRVAGCIGTDIGTTG